MAKMRPAQQWQYAHTKRSRAANLSDYSYIRKRDNNVVSKEVTIYKTTSINVAAQPAGSKFVVMQPFLF